jgi:hypothetical protein
MNSVKTRKKRIVHRNPKSARLYCTRIRNRRRSVSDVSAHSRWKRKTGKPNHKITTKEFQYVSAEERAEDDEEWAEAKSTSILSSVLSFSSTLLVKLSRILSFHFCQIPSSTSVDVFLALFLSFWPTLTKMQRFTKYARLGARIGLQSKSEIFRRISRLGCHRGRRWSIPKGGHLLEDLMGNPDNMNLGHGTKIETPSSSVYIIR